MTGRPTIYSQEIADSICEWLAQGESLRQFCLIDGNPGYSTIQRWLLESESFREKHAGARSMQAHNDADRMNELIGKLEKGEIDANVARVMMDGLKWTSGRRLPRVYGDKLALGGDADGAPIQVTWAVDKPA